MNLSGFIDVEDNVTFQQFDVNVTEQPQSYDYDLPELSYAIYMLDYVMKYVCLALGVPGNILSAIVWLRRHVTSKNSSALYLAVLAINDLLYLLIYIILLHAIPSFGSWKSWMYDCITIIVKTTTHMEPLLVLSFSVERLIAISCPLQVRCMRLNL